MLQEDHLDKLQITFTRPDQLYFWAMRVCTVYILYLTVHLPYIVGLLFKSSLYS